MLHNQTDSSLKPYHSAACFCREIWQPAEAKQVHAAAFTSASGAAAAASLSGAARRTASPRGVPLRPRRSRPLPPGTSPSVQPLPPASWMFRPVLALLLTAGVCCGAPEAAHSRPLNYRPIIGILAQENLDVDPAPHGTSYIAASYVKYLESAGARVVPIRINRTEEEYSKLFNSINGLLLPGGDINIEYSQFTRTAKIFYKLAVKANDEGDYFPLWGTCQGFQQLTVLTANKNLLTNTDTEAVALPLTFAPGSTTSRMFRQFPKNLLQSLAQESITGNFHSWSLSVQNYSRNSNLKRFYKVLSTNTDGTTEFISTMEAYRYPFYAVQWHPEKSPFEWLDKPGMVHSASAVQASFYTASFFVSEARKNQHKFSSPQEEEKALIYNYIPEFKKDPFYFVQNYYFN